MHTTAFCIAAPRVWAQRQRCPSEWDRTRVAPLLPTRGATCAAEQSARPDTPSTSPPRRPELASLLESLRPPGSTTDSHLHGQPSTNYYVLCFISGVLIAAIKAPCLRKLVHRGTLPFRLWLFLHLQNSKSKIKSKKSCKN